MHKCHLLTHLYCLLFIVYLFEEPNHKNRINQKSQLVNFREIPYTCKV